VKFLLPLVLLFPVLLAAQEDKIDQLATVDGKTYDAVTIRKVEPDGLSILHAAGTAKVPFEKLSADLQTKYGYDKEAAAEHRKQLAKAQRLQDAAEREASTKRKQAAADQAVAEVDKEFAEKVQKAAKMVRIDASSKSRIGLIGDVEEATLTAEAIRSTLGRTVDQTTFWGYRDAAKGGVIAATEKAEVVIARRESSTSIFWEGKAWRIGRIQYTNTRGLQVTMLRYTASEKEAAAFYKKN
jgi:hypothetical protein